MEEENPTGIFEGETHNEKLEESMLEGTDDFFKKAEAFAEGKYDEVKEPEMTIEKVDLPEEIVAAPVAGFTDLDGDGDEITDDAIIVSDEEE